MTKTKSPKQIAATLSRTKDPKVAHTLYLNLLNALPSGTNVLPYLPKK